MPLGIIWLVAMRMSLDPQVHLCGGGDEPDGEARIQIETRRQIEFAALADDELGGVADQPLIRGVVA